tara:strand:- start:349 stop:468 length:120 start_codon:yes stop_codon:yes gene_type:complete
LRSSAVISASAFLSTNSMTGAGGAIILTGGGFSIIGATT